MKEIAEKSLSKLRCLSLSFLFRIHERETATEKELDIILRMSLERVVFKRFKQSTKWTPKVTNTTSTYRCCKTGTRLLKNTLA